MIYEAAGFVLVEKRLTATSASILQGDVEVALQA
jgi:hypothetical protein